MSSIMIDPSRPHPPLRRRLLGRAQRQVSALVLTTLVCIAAPAQCQENTGWAPEQWDRARAALMAAAPGTIAPAIDRWRQLIGTENAGFDAYAGFVMSWPGLPAQDQMRLAAEKSLNNGGIDDGRIIAFFDRYPPLSNPARAQYALALARQGRPQANAMALAAWRGGTMSDAAESQILSRWGNTFTLADNDARLSALLADGATTQATRALPRASATMRGIAQARLQLQGGPSRGGSMPDASGDADSDPNAMARITAQANAQVLARSGAPVEAGPTYAALPTPYATPYATATPVYTPPPAYPPPPASVLNADAGYVYDRARATYRRGSPDEAASALAQAPMLVSVGDSRTVDPRKWVGLSLTVARAAGPSSAASIARAIARSLGGGANVSGLDYAVRDDFTSLMWLGAMSAYRQLGDRASAANLFAEYAEAARSPMTRAKGYYWAGRMLAGVPGREGEARATWYANAARYPDQFYGLLALEQLRRPIPPLTDPPHPQPTGAQRAAFYASPLAQAVRELARYGDWQTTVRFFREMARQAQTETDFVLVIDYARQLGRRDLAVIAGQAAANAGLSPGQTFRQPSFPLIPTPPGSNWTVIHAISRQESQFSQNALSRTGAQGLMQLMPGTAADQAGKLGLPYTPSTLTTDPLYNMTLGDAYFGRLMTSFGGSYPLAIAAYNSGPGNVRKWLASNGDPRTGAVDWVDWIERIPFSETRGYVAHVMENMVVYEAMNPDRAMYRGADPMSHYLGKQGPG